MAGRGFASVGELRGRLAAARMAHPETYVRAQYMRMLTEYADTAR
jgi:hypothetical protein